MGHLHSPAASLWMAKASITRMVSLSRSRSNSSMISPWKLGWLKPRTMSCTGPMAMVPLFLSLPDGQSGASRPWAAMAQMTKMSTAMMSMDQNG
jgi:hypothetical protein